MTREEQDQIMEDLLRWGEERGIVNRKLSMFNDNYNAVAAVQVATVSSQTKPESEDAQTSLDS